MRTFGIILISIMLFSLASGQIQVVDLDPDEPLPNQNGGATDLTTQQIATRLNQINTKLDNTATKQEVDQLTAFAITEINKEVNRKMDFLLLAVIMSVIFIVVISFSVYFLLLGKRRLPGGGK